MSEGPATGSSRAADVRLLASHAVHSVSLLDVDDDVRAAFDVAGVAVVEHGADLVVSSTRAAKRAAALGSPTVVVLGRARGPLRAAGYQVQPLVVRWGEHGARLVVPLDQPGAVRRALLAPRPGRSRAKQLGVSALVSAMRAGLPVGAAITLGSRRPGPPLILRAASEVGLPSELTWHLQAGDGDDLQRMLWLCAGPGAASATWAVKASRVRGYSTPFTDDAAAFGLVADAPTAVGRHIPTLLGLIEVDGLHGSVESAAAGWPLHELLLSLASRAEALDIIRAVAGWATALGVATAQPPAALVGELEWLEDVVVPAWQGRGVDPTLMESLPPLPAVVQHGDLGLWNIVGEDGAFAVVDWESARPTGMPLWDVAYFVTDALGYLSARGDDDDRKLDAMVALLRGESDTSPILFELLANAAHACEVPLDAVGGVVTLGWLHHGLSADERAGARRRHGVAGAKASKPGLFTTLAERWLTDPVLGPAWPAFTRAVG